MSKADELIKDAAESLLNSDGNRGMTHATALAVLGLLLSDNGSMLNAINAAYLALDEAA